MKNSLVFLYNHEGRTSEEARKVVMHVLKDFKSVHPCDVEQLWNAALVSFKVTRVVGMTTVVTVEVSRNSGIQRDSTITLGRTVMVRSFTYTPNNRNCSGVGNILLSMSFETCAEAADEYRKLNNLFMDED